TLVDVGAVRLLTDRVQIESTHQLLEFQIATFGAGLHPHPFGSGWLAGESTVDQDRCCRPLLGREGPGLEQTIDFKAGLLTLAAHESCLLGLGPVVSEDFDKSG